MTNENTDMMRQNLTDSEYLSPSTFNDNINLIQKDEVLESNIESKNINTYKSNSSSYAEDIDDHILNIGSNTWLQKQLRLRSSEYTDDRILKIFVGTQNVQSQSPPLNLEEQINVKDQAFKFCDIYAFGLQEIIGMTASTVASSLIFGTDNQMALQRQAFKKMLNEYCLIIEHNMVGIAIFVFVRKDLYEYCSNFQALAVPCGIMNVVGNKGAIGVQMKIFNSKLCFVTAHFAAGHSNVSDRNDDFETICEKMNFSVPEENINNHIDNCVDSNHIKNQESISDLQSEQHLLSRDNIDNDATSYDSKVTDLTNAKLLDDSAKKLYSKEVLDNAQSTLKLLSHETIFWFGDLNYRLALKVDEKNLNFVHNMINEILINKESAKNAKRSNSSQLYSKERKHCIDILISHDQLYRQIVSGQVFQGFHEGRINFLPTYKYIPGKNQFERRTDEKARMPAQCDRILQRSKSDLKLEQSLKEEKKEKSGNKQSKIQSSQQRVKLICYNMLKQPNVSDHRPVFALFKFTAKCIDENKFNKLNFELQRKIDIQENLQRPNISVFGYDDMIRFDTLYYDQPQKRQFYVVNNGRQIARVIIKKSCNAGIEKDNILKKQKFKSYGQMPQLSIEPKEFIIEPKHKKEIQVTMHVDRKSRIDELESINLAANCDIINIGKNQGDESNKQNITKTNVNNRILNLDETLIISTENAGDIFVPLSATYYCSTFGRSLYDLVHKRSLLQNKQTDSNSQSWLTVDQNSSDKNELEEDNQFSNIQTNIPVALWRLVDFLYTHGMHDSNLFRFVGNVDIINKIRVCLDEGIDFPSDAEIHSATSVLIYFFESLQTPILPLRYQLTHEDKPNFNSNSSSKSKNTVKNIDLDESSSTTSSTSTINDSFDDWFCKLTTSLPKENHSTFVYLLSFLLAVLDCSNDNKTNIELIIKKFGPALVGRKNYTQYSTNVQLFLTKIFSNLSDRKWKQDDNSSSVKKETEN